MTKITEEYSKYRVEDFATNSDFINWVLSPNETTNAFWKGVIRKFPSQKKKIEEAITLINSVQAVDNPVAQERIDKILYNIRLRLDNNKSLKLYRYMRWAAVLIILLGSSILISQFNQTSDFDFALGDNSQIDKAQIILADGSIRSIEKEESEIEIRSSGEVIVNNDTLKTSKLSISKEEHIHVVMPYGKQSSIQLPDGTTVFINAGSRISFPPRFLGSKRDVNGYCSSFFVRAAANNRSIG